MAYRPGLSNPALAQAWAAGTAYTVGQLITNDGTLYQVQSTHTAGATFAATAAALTSLVPGIAPTHNGGPTTFAQAILTDGTYVTVAELLALAGSPAVVISAVPTGGWTVGTAKALTGASANLSNIATGYAVLWSGTAEVGTRQAFASSSAFAALSFTPATANATHSIRVYSANTAGTLLAESAIFSVVASGTASAYSTTLSAASGVAGTAVTLTFAPTGNAWPAGEVITPTVAGVPGTFSPATVSVSGTAAGTCSFTPSAAGTATLSSTASPSLTSTTGALSYTVTASGGSAVGPNLAMTGATYDTTAPKFGAAALAGGSGQATLTLAANSSYVVSFWVKASSAPASAILVVRDGNSTSTAFGIGVDGKLITRGNSGASSPAGGPNICDGSWHWLTFQYYQPSGGCQVWVDGTYVNGVSGMVFSANPLLVIDTNGGAAKVDEVELYSAPIYPGGAVNITVPSAEVASSATSLLAAYRFNGNGNSI